MAEAHNPADRPFAAHQDGFDVATVFVADEERSEARAAREVDDLDIVTGAVEQFAARVLHLFAMRRDQRVVRVPQPSQQVVMGPLRDREAVSLCFHGEAQ